MAESGNTIYLAPTTAFPTKEEAASILRACLPVTFKPRSGVVVVAMADPKKRNGLLLPDRCRLTPDCGTVAASSVPGVQPGMRVCQWFDGGGFTQYESKAGTVRVYGATAVGKENPYHRGVVMDLDTRKGFEDWVLVRREVLSPALEMAGKPQYDDVCQQGQRKVVVSRDRAEALEFWGGDDFGLTHEFMLVQSEQILATVEAD